MFEEKEKRDSVSLEQGQQMEKHDYFFTTVWADSLPKDINTPLNKTQRPHPHTSLKIISFLTWLNLKLAQADEADTERFPLTFPEGSRECFRKQKHSMKMQISVPSPFHCKSFTGRDLLIGGKRNLSCWTNSVIPPTPPPALALFYVTDCIKRGIVWRFPLERTGKAGRNVWLLSFLIVQKTMRGHAWLIYSMLSNRKQPLGNGVIVMKCNIIVKCHVLVCLLEGSKSFPGSLSGHGVSGPRGGGIWAETIP